MLKGSLSNLSSHHIQNGGDLTITKSVISHLPQEAQSLLLSSGKQYLPYEYLSSLDKLNETVIPPKASFFSTLQQRGLTDEEYNHVREVWDKSSCSTLGEYVNLYLQLDVGLLADIYLNWRKTLLEVFKLDSLYFLTLASYAIEAFYFQSRVVLDCISDPDLYQVINRNIRGGFCSVGKRHVIANNRHTNANFNPAKDASNYLLYIDFNSLYPTCMSTFKLPCGEFKQLNEGEQESLILQGLKNIDPNGDIGYFIHCKISKPSLEVIKRTDCFPLCLSQKNVGLENLSPYSQSLLQDSNIKLTKSNKKLIAHHEGVDDYLIMLPLL